MSVVDFIGVTPPTTISIKSEHPGDAVVGYRGDLFRKPDGGRTERVQSWTAGELEDGVEFEFDSDARGFLFRLTVQVEEDASMVIHFDYDPRPPAAETYELELSVAEGEQILRDWAFTRALGGQ
jgi:hypothetical protein